MRVDDFLKTSLPKSLQSSKAYDCTEMADPDLDDSQPPDSRLPALIGLLVIMLMIIGGLFLVHALHGTSEIQDCAMSGRTNCVPLYPPAPGS